MLEKFAVLSGCFVLFLRLQRWLVDLVETNDVSQLLIVLLLGIVECAASRLVIL